jgi:hypothetical protein
MMANLHWPPSTRMQIRLGEGLRTLIERADIRRGRRINRRGLSGGKPMLKRLLFTLVLSTNAPAMGRAEDISVDLAGIGNKTCAHWLSSPDHKSEGAVWIYGFWSGLNYVAAASEQDQSRATSTEMIAAVETACKRQPSRVLASAAWSAYIARNKK